MSVTIKSHCTRCYGTGYLSQFNGKCRACNGTGEDRMSVEKQIKALLLERVRPVIEGKVAFVGTGHRAEKLGGYNPRTRELLSLFAMAAIQKAGAEVVVSGMATGWDMAVANAARRLELPLVAVVPCRNQAEKWNPADQRYWQVLLAYAKTSGKVLLVQDAYDARCMQLRNEVMVDLLALAGEGSVLGALYDGTVGGTANCVAYAKSAKAKILNYWNAWNRYRASQNPQ